jgi:hypothetical protein
LVRRVRYVRYVFQFHASFARERVWQMISLGVGKEVGTHSAHSAPLARLRARFGILGPEPKAPTPAPSTVPHDTAEPAREVASVVSLLDLPPDRFEEWQERVCIMHFDGGLPWPDAERLALADVLRQTEPVNAPEYMTEPTPEIIDAEQMAAATCSNLFPAEAFGRYGPAL